VISPEGCASILWRDAAFAETAAKALRLTAQDLFEFGLVDRIVAEPAGGAHADPQAMGAALDEALHEALAVVRDLPVAERVRLRYEKFRKMGDFEDRFARERTSKPEILEW